MLGDAAISLRYGKGEAVDSSLGACPHFFFLLLSVFVVVFLGLSLVALGFA